MNHVQGVHCVGHRARVCGHPFITYPSSHTLTATTQDKAALDLVSKAIQLQQMHSHMDFAAFPAQMLPPGAAPFPFPPYGPFPPNGN